MNPVISTFFQNYGLLPDFDAFREAQRDLMLPDVHIESRDHRGWQVLDGVDAYVESVREWSQFYGNSDDRGIEPVLDNGTDVEVKVTGTIVFRKPVAGVSRIANSDHDWREHFVLREGRIASARIDMGIEKLT